MKVLIVGATGTIGSAVRNELAARHDEHMKDKVQVLSYSEK